jgi:tRNA (cmo5U34)-methyltransferase
MDFQQEKYAKGAADYDQRIRTLFPFYETIHAAINAILRSVLGAESELLIAGAGTGAEILELGETNPSWRFLGVDPAKAMLDLAKEKIDNAGLTDRVRLFNGFVADLPIGKLFDGATSAMIMHFVPDDGGKIEFLRAISSRKIGRTIGSAGYPWRFGRTGITAADRSLEATTGSRRWQPGQN